MKDLDVSAARAKAIITTACRMLQEAPARARLFHLELSGAGADCYVLLSDASKLFCRAVSEFHGEAASRWTPVLPELLLSHPERCAETLALVERKEFAGLTHFQFASA